MSHKAIRSKEEIQKLMTAIIEDLKTLPDKDIFGASNLESRNESVEWIDTLAKALATNMVDRLDYTEVEYWLTNEKGTLGKDYGIE